MGNLRQFLFAATIASVCAYPGWASAQIEFRRGDVNGDGTFDAIAEAIFLSEALFGGGTAPGCLDSADVNDDGTLDVTDILLVLAAGFDPAPPALPAPFPACGLDPTPDALSCDSYFSCALPSTAPESPDYIMTIGDLSGSIGDDETVSVLLDNVGMPLSGWSLGVCHDSNLLEIEKVDLGEIFDTVVPDFEIRNVYPGSGWTAGVVLSLSTGVTLSSGLGHELYRAEYELLAVGATGIELCGTLGDPPVPVVVRRAFTPGPLSPISIDGLALIEVSGPSTTFRRGDGNGDGTVDLGDVIYTINWIFQGGPSFGCRSAADANDDGAIDLGDPIWVINYIFTSGASPPSPFPNCDEDPTADSLTCNSYPNC